MKWFLVLLTLLLSACSGLPPVMRDKSYANIHLSVVNTDISRYQNTRVRWGGTIISVVNEKNSSQIQALFYPVGSYGRPLVDRKTEGRYAMSTPLFLDPAIYKEGTEITVTGVISGQIQQQVGKKTLALPLLTIDNIHIWPLRQQQEGGFYPYPRYYYPYYYNPYFGYYY